MVINMKRIILGDGMSGMVIAACLDYLGYDPTYIKMFIKIYNSKYDIMEDIKQPAEVRNLRAKEVDKAVRKAIWQYKIKHFWDK